MEQLLADAAESLFPAGESIAGIDINAKDSTGDTPLHVFLWRGDDDAACALVRHGADVNSIGEMGEVPLHVAVRQAEVGTLVALLAAGARKDAVSEFGQTPQELAKEIGRLAVFEEAIVLARAQKSGQ